MRIDVHAHYWTDAYLNIVAALGKADTDTQRGIGAGGRDELAARLKLMDRAGLDVQVLSAAPQLPYSNENKAAGVAARFVNGEYAALVAAHPDRSTTSVTPVYPSIKSARSTRATLQRDSVSRDRVGAMTRWQAERSQAGSRAYIERFDRLAADGADLDGEARMVDVLLSRRSRVLDAGCGTGRVGAELARRGHVVTAVDLDPVLIEEASKNADLDVRLGDLATLDLEGLQFDAIVAAGNVMVYLEPGTERAVLARLKAHLDPAGALVTGFATDRQYTLERFDADLAAIGLIVENRFSTWDLRPMQAGADWAVTVARARTA